MLYYLSSKFPVVNTRPYIIKPGWVLSKYVDPIVFVGISILSLAMPLIIKLDLFTYVIWIILGNGHAICSMYPVLFSIKRGTSNTLFYLLIIIGCMTFSIILFNLDPELLYLMFSTSLLWHHSRQKIGWIHYSTKKIKNLRNCYDEVIIYNACLMPIIWRMIENNNNNSDVFFSAVTLPDYIPLPFESVSLYFHLKAFTIALFWSINILWVFKEIKTVLDTGIINPVKYCVIFSGIICFSVAYTLFPHGYWWGVNGMVHTTSYILFTYFFSKNHKTVNSENNKNRIQYIFLKNIFLYLFLVLIYGFVTASLSAYSKHNLSWWSFNFLYPLMFSTFFIHCSVDAFIWKKRFIGKILGT